MELVLASAFCECLGYSSAPEAFLFQRFRGHWTSIAPDKYEDAFSDEFVKLKLALGVGESLI